MRLEERIDRICELLKKLWHKHPDQRFGQLFENYILVGGEQGDNTGFNLVHQEDDITEQMIEHYIEENKGE